MADKTEKEKKFEVLDNYNYGTWEFRMSMHLVDLELFDYCTTATPADNFDEFMKKSKKALAKIAMHVDNDQIYLIKKATTAKEAWDLLKEQHSHGSRAARIRARTRLYNVRLSAGGSMMVHMTRINALLDRLANLGVKIDDEEKIGALLASVANNEQFRSVVSAMDAWPDNKLKFEDVKTVLYNEWEKKNDYDEQQATEQADEEIALKATRRRRRKVNTRKCFECSSTEHLVKNCPFKRDDDIESRMSNNNRGIKSAKLARLSSYYTKCFNSSVVSSNFKSSDVFIDSGATSTMFHDKSLFTHLKSVSDEWVHIANGQKLPVKGIGNVKLSIYNNENEIVDFLLNDVLFVPDIDSNLLSLKSLTKNNSSVVFDGKFCRIVSKNGNFVIGTHHEGLYKVKVAEKCLKVAHNDDDCIHIWHKRFAHRNLRDVKLTLKKMGIKWRNCKCSDLCEACIQGKMSEFPFPKAAKSVDNVFDLFVSDVCEMPVISSSFGKSKYFMTIIDARSDFTFVYYIAHKSDVADIVIEHIEMIKTTFGRKCKTLRSDRGTEYLSKKLQIYLRKQGIRFESTVGYAPAQNGIAERKNRTLVESARTMLIDAKLPKHLWAEAISNANYTQNRTADSRTKEIPYDIFFGRPVKEENFHVFGSLVFSMIPKIKRKKLDSKATKMQFMGYDNVSKGFRLYDSDRRAVIVSRNVLFHDDKTKDFLPNRESREVTPKTSEKRKIISYGFESSDESDHDEDINEDDEVIENTSRRSRNNLENSGDHLDDTDDTYRSISNSTLEDNNDNRQSSTPLRRTSRINAGVPPVRFGFDDDDFTIQEENIDDSDSADPTHNLENERAYTVDGNVFYEPTTYKRARECPENQKWKLAMDDEIEAHKLNCSWDWVDPPVGKTLVGCRWIYKLKQDSKGKVSQYKARLVAQGFNQKFGIDYNEVFAPTARQSSLRLLLSHVGYNNLKVKQFDVKNAFLNGELEEEIFMKPPPGYEKSNKCLRLRKSIYGLRQAANVWNKTIDNVLVNIGFEANSADKCLYSRNVKSGKCFVLIHVDDILIASKSLKDLNDTAYNINKHFKIKDLGEAKHYLGIDITRNSKGDIFISQSAYIDSIIIAAKLEDAKTSRFPLDPGYFKIKDDKLLPSNELYRKIVGKLLYLSTNTRPDIAASIAFLSQKITNPTQTDLNELKRVVRYLKLTRNLKLRLSDKQKSAKLVTFSDANWAEDEKDRKSNSGYLIMKNGGAISWCCRKQDIVTLSSMEAEYVALSETCKEVLWLEKIIATFDDETSTQRIVHTDSQSCISHINNQKFSNRSKHIDTRYHFMKDLHNDKRIVLKYVATNDNIADMLTKPLKHQKIKYFRELAGLM